MAYLSRRFHDAFAGTVVLTLKLFGTAVVEAAGGLVAGRAAKGHRLALLAVLAVTRGRPTTRSKLTALLWPESPADRARHQLSDTLYILRAALGADVIGSTGDELVLNLDAVASDVATFERLLDEGKPAPAVELYTGPLLDGFHLPDGGEFERWLDAERARLGQRYATALEELAATGEARGEFAVAVGWWRTLAAHEPYSGRIALRLMCALEAMGDRAEALRHARLHAALLRQEFDAEPDAGVTAFAERLRVEPPAREVNVPAVAAVAHKAGPVGAPPALGMPAPPSGVAASGSREVAVPSGVRPPARTMRTPWRARATAAAAAALLVLAVAWSHGVLRARAAVNPFARSLAVLPFVDMSADPANGYFSDGLSEQIITALSQVEGLRVVARTSSFALRDTDLDVRKIGDTLRVEAVLEGSVRREGDQFRVTAQLIDARSGYQLWSGVYDRQVADLLAVQDEIARAIVGALELRLPSRFGTRQRRIPNFAAYDLYLRALHLRNGVGDEALGQATEYLDRAIELEPDFALAHAAKATVMGPRIYYGHVPQQQGLREARVSVARALALDPDLGEAHVALGMVRLFFDWEWDAAARALERAIALNPNDPHAWHHLANHLRVRGRYAEAVDARRRAVTLDPLDARSHITLVVDLVAAGRIDDAIAQHARSLRIDPVHAQLLGLGPWPPIGVTVHLARGSEADALQELLRVAVLRGAAAGDLDAIRAAFARDGAGGMWDAWLRMDMEQAGEAANPLRMAILHAYVGDAERALDWLERAHAERAPGMIFLRQERAFTELRSHSRFARIEAEMRFPTP